MRPGQTISVLVFPFGYAAEAPTDAPPAAAPAAPAVPAVPAPPAAAGSPMAAPAMSQAQQDLANYLTAAVKGGFLASPAFSVASYHKTSSLVQRAKAQEVLREEHLKDLVSATGAVDQEKARMLTYRLGIQTMLLGTIEMKPDQKANSAELTLTAQLINSATGEVLRSALVSGAAAGAEGVPMNAVEERAAQEVAQKVLPALGIELVPLPNVAPAKAEKTAKRGKHGKTVKTAKASTKPEHQGTAKLSSDDKKAAEDAKRQARKAADDAKKAERAAKKAQKDAEKAAEKQQRETDQDRDRSERKVPSGEGKRSARKTAPVVPEEVAQDNPQAQAAPAVQPAPPAPKVPLVRPVTPAKAPSSVQGFTDPAGSPVPYGYALGKDALNKNAIPARNRQGLKVPAWLGLAGFLAGISFLL
jgi:DNA polymerase III gamma/tau subunit